MIIPEGDNQMILQEGTVIRNNYTVERLLGVGAFAEVYRVEHSFLGQQAMKVFKTPGTKAEVKEALGEALTLSRMMHRNIIRVFDADIIEIGNENRGFFTMEYLAGGTLADFRMLYGNNNFVPVETAVEIVKQICQGLKLAHSSDPPMVHRDLKPQNILIGEDQQGLRACVSDFGLAKSVNPLTQTVTMRGARIYKPPEVLRDPEMKKDSCAGDVWALGSTLYHLLTDFFPYTYADQDVQNLRYFEKSLKPASHWNIEVDQELDQILLRALAVNRDERYQNAMEMLADLSHWQPRSKSKEGRQVPPDPAKEQEARLRVAQAVEYAKQYRTLPEAIKLMEQAFNEWPPLIKQYESRVNRWRLGIMDVGTTELSD